MSQRHVEQMIGRMATDEDFRRRFATDREAVLDELAGQGLALTQIERLALLSLDVSACERFAGDLDPRLLKASLRSTQS